MQSLQKRIHAEMTPNDMYLDLKYYQRRYKLTGIPLYKSYIWLMKEALLREDKVLFKKSG